MPHVLREKGSSESQNRGEYRQSGAIVLHKAGWKAIKIAEVLNVTRGAARQRLRAFSNVKRSEEL